MHVAIPGTQRDETKFIKFSKATENNRAIDVNWNDFPFNTYTISCRYHQPRCSYNVQIQKS